MKETHALLLLNSFIVFVEKYIIFQNRYILKYVIFVLIMIKDAVLLNTVS